MNESCTLIGILDDGWLGLSDVARVRLVGAGCVIGADRTLNLVEDWLAPGVRQLAMDGALAEVPGWVRQAWADGLDVAVLATGDPLCHGIAGRLIAALGRDVVEVLPAPSTLQVAFARLKRPWQDVRIASCHGVDTGDWAWGATPDHSLYRVLRAVALHPLVGVFTSPANGPDRIARALLAVGYGAGVRLSVAARLTCPDEVLFPRLRLEEAAGRAFPMPNVALLERTDDAETGGAADPNQGAVDEPGPDHGVMAAGRRSNGEGPGPIFGLADEGFSRQGGGDDTGLITKSEVRAVSLAKLGLRADSLIWDIGAGSGAVGLEASRVAYLGHCWAIEKESAQVADARANARRLRASNYSLCEGRAPDGLADWPDPDAVFIGGSGGALEALIALCAARLRPGGRLVMNLIALENLTAATAALDWVGLGWDLIQLGVARSRPLLGLHRFAALNPVWILSARKEP